MDKLTPNELAFIALANEYCHAMEKTLEYETRDDFVGKMLRLLPRLYISMNDLEQDPFTDAYIEQALDEDVYDIIRERVAILMADEDTYLEVFVEDMKYSDTPISASISENLADLYQEFFNLIHSVQDALTETQHEMLCQCKINAENYWSQTLCNVLRALNATYYVQ